MGAERAGGPFCYRLGAQHETWCRSCGEGARAESFDALARWRDRHKCESTIVPEEARDD